VQGRIPEKKLLLPEPLRPTTVSGRRAGCVTYDVVSWTEGVDFSKVFVRLEALDRDLLAC
jgi:hypothetical protein